jgi:GNAT superfamily N-acetyltransferase
MNREAIIIRPMTDDDQLVVSEIVSADYRKLAAGEGYTSHEIECLLAERGSLEAIAAQRRQYTFWVAVSGNTVVGVVAIRDNTIEKLYIAPEYYHYGVGTMLFQWAESTIRQQGYGEMILGAFPGSVGFYERMGMTESGRKIVKTGPIRGHQFVLMHKPLETDTETPK